MAQVLSLWGVWYLEKPQWCFQISRTQLKCLHVSTHSLQLSKGLTDPWGATKDSECLLYTPLICSLGKMPALEKLEHLGKTPNSSCQLQWWKLLYVLRLFPWVSLTVCPSNNTQRKRGPHNPLISRTIRKRSPAANRWKKVYVYIRERAKMEIILFPLSYEMVTRDGWGKERTGRWAYRGHWGTLLNKQ